MYIYIYIYTVYLTLIHANIIYIYIYIHIVLLNYVRMSTLLIKKNSHKRYPMPTALVIVCGLWAFKIFIGSELLR